MELSNKSYLQVAVESTPGTVVSPTVFLPFKSKDLTGKTNTAVVENIEGTTLKNTKIVKDTIDVSGNIEFNADRINLAYFLPTVLGTPTITNNGDGTYKHSYNIENGYGLKSLTAEISENFLTERASGIVGSAVEVTDGGALVSAAFTLLGLKNLTSVYVTNVTGDAVTVDGFVGNFLTGDDVAKNGNYDTASGTIASISGQVITLGTGEGTNFAIGDVLSLFRQTTVTNTDCNPFRGYEKLNVKFADSLVGLGSANVTGVEGSSFKIENELEARFLSSSNFARKIQQGGRIVTGKFTIDGDEAYRQFNIYQRVGYTFVEMLFEGDVIGSGTRKESLKFVTKAQYTNGPLSLAYGEMQKVDFEFNGVGNLTLELVTTVASI